MHPDWFNRLLEANGRIYSNPMSSIVLSLAVVGAAHIMSDPDYPARLAETPWLGWAMFTAVELFSLGMRASHLIILGSLILAVYQWALKKGTSGIKTES